MRIGFSYEETLDLPLGDLKTFIAIEQIKREGMKEKRSEEDEFFDLLNIR